MEALYSIQDFFISLSPEDQSSKILFATPVIGTLFYHAMRSSHIKAFNDHYTENETAQDLQNKLGNIVQIGRRLGAVQLICGLAALYFAGLTPLGYAAAGICLASYAFLWIPLYLPLRELVIAMADPHDPESRSETYERHCSYV